MTEGGSGSVTPRTPVKGGKAKDMSKNLLGSARKIRARLQPALVKESRSVDQNNYRRLQFLDQTLEGMIKRFEDEYPETRLPPTTNSYHQTKPAPPTSPSPSPATTPTPPPTPTSTPPPSTKPHPHPKTKTPAPSGPCSPATTRTSPSPRVPFPKKKAACTASGSNSGARSSSQNKRTTSTPPQASKTSLGTSRCCAPWSRASAERRSKIGLINRGRMLCSRS